MQHAMRPASYCYRGARPLSLLRIGLLLLDFSHLFVTTAVETSLKPVQSDLGTDLSHALLVCNCHTTGSEDEIHFLEGELFGLGN